VPHCLRFFVLPGPLSAVDTLTNLTMVQKLMNVHTSTSFYAFATVGDPFLLFKGAVGNGKIDWFKWPWVATMGLLTYRCTCCTRSSGSR
jgi:hypothetical protein